MYNVVSLEFRVKDELSKRLSRPSHCHPSLGPSVPPAQELLTLTIKGRRLRMNDQMLQLQRGLICFALLVTVKVWWPDLRYNPVLNLFEGASDSVALGSERTESSLDSFARVCVCVCEAIFCLYCEAYA